MEPEKEAGAGWKPTPKTNRSHRAYARCEHSSTRIELCPKTHVHHAAEVCSLCGAWVRWVEKPSSLSRRIRNALRLAWLEECQKLSPWEKGFVRDVMWQRKLSPRQQHVLDRLAASYLEGRTT
jgi:hypothetical protein